MTTKPSSDRFAITEVVPAFSGTLVAGGGDGANALDRRKIAEHASKQIAGIVAQRHKARVMMQCLADSAQEAHYHFAETQDQLHRTEQKCRGKPYEQRILDFHGGLSRAHAAYLFGALKLEAETMALIIGESPFVAEPEPRKSFLDRLRGE
jgi:hypothetical protein